MARSLTDTLKEQQKWGLISWPYVQARITKKWGGVIRYDFEKVGRYFQTLRPNAPGAECNIPFEGDCSVCPNHYDCIYIPNDATQVLNLETPFTSNWYRDLYALQDISDVATIYSVTVYARCKTSTASPEETGLKLAIKTAGGPWESPEITVPGTSWTWHSHTWPTNPDTDAAWTQSEINALQAGISIRNCKTAPDVFGVIGCSEVYIAVETDHSIEEDYLHTATMPGDGSLIRLRVANPGSTKDLFYQRIASPVPESDFSDWTDLELANVIAVASASLAAEVTQFYIDTSGEVYQRTSADNGENWDAWALIDTLDVAAVSGLAAAYKPDGDILLLISGLPHRYQHWYNTGDLFATTWATRWMAQTFITEVAHTITKLSLPLAKEGTPGTFTVSIRAVNGAHHPTPPDLAVGTYNADTLPDYPDFKWVEIDLTDFGLDAETEYAIVMRGGVDDDNLVYIEATSDPVYPDGVHSYSTDSGTIWITVEGDVTVHFEEWGYVDLDTSPQSLFIAQRETGVWSSISAKTHGFDDVTGVAVIYDQDWNIVYTYGKAATEKGTNIIIFGDGHSEEVGVWSSPQEIIKRSDTEPYNYKAPFLAKPDTTRLYFVEGFAQEEVYNHIFYSHMPPSADFDIAAWLEPVPLEPESQYGLAFTFHGSYAWLTNANRVFRALATEDALVLTARVIEIDSRDYPDIFKGSLKVVLDNTGGWYNDFNRLGQQLEVGIGYKTSGGNEYSLVPYRWITKFKLVAPPWYPLRMIYPVGVVGTLEIETEDAWNFLYRYRTRRHLEWAAGQKSVKELLQFFIARSGLDFDVLSQSDAVQNFKPAFEVRVGTSYRTAIKNLLKMVPDQLVFREAKVLLRNPTTAEPVDWTYHTTIGTALLVFRGKYGLTAWNPNRAEVWGDTFMKMVANWPQVQTVRDRLSRVTSPTYPDLTRAEERAEAELRRAEILTGGESLMIAPMNCGLEPWDILQITDSNAGVNAIKRRVIRVKAYWNARHWSYHQIITLGAD